MSETSLNKIIQYGTSAARIAFTPNPASGSQVLYIWFDTDSAPDTYIWDGAAWVQINPAGGVGDVIGPGVAVADRIAVFDGTTGKLIKDGGKTISAAEIAGAAIAVAALSPLDYITHSDESVVLPNSRQLMPGTGITFDDTVANERTVNAAGGGGSGDVVGPGVAVDDRIATFDGTTGKLIQDGGQTIAQLQVPPVQYRTYSLGINIGNGIDDITTGVKGYIRIPVAITLIDWTLLAQDGLTGSIVIDVWADTYANFPPVNADSITNAHEPTISSGIKAEDTNITDWNESIPAGSVIGFNVDSVSTFKKILFQLSYTID